MLRELAPSASAPALELIDQPTDEQATAFYAAARKTGFAFALAAVEPTEEETESDEPAVPQTMSLLYVVEEAEKKNAIKHWRQCRARQGVVSTPDARVKDADRRLLGAKARARSQARTARSLWPRS